jgi:hypothetical protein
MPENANDIAATLDERLKKKGGAVLTLNWNDFYELCGNERLKEPRKRSIEVAAWTNYGLIVAYGHNVVLVAHDRNFAGS